LEYRRIEVSEVARRTVWSLAGRLDLPSWSGGPAKQLHLILQDGLGDIFCTLRYLEQIRARGVQEISAWAFDRYSEDFIAFLNAQTWMPRIKRIPSEPIAYAEWHKSIDCMIGTGELEAVLNIQIKDIPPPPHFAARPESIAKYRCLRENTTKPLVGIVWAADQKEFPCADDGAYRSLKASQLESIIRSIDVEWVQLQYKRQSPVSGILDPQTDSWSDTAAVIANLDAVVTVDTSTMHLANAMRKTRSHLINA
jgi:hypothetical protein